MRGVSLLAFSCAACVALGDVTIENDTFALRIGSDAVARSLVIRSTGEECLDLSVRVPIVAATQDRPFNNEIKLIHPNKRTVYPAVSVRAENDDLVFGFAHRQYEARVGVRKRRDCLVFELKDFICDRKTTYDYLQMDIPPVASLRLLQLPVKNRVNFGDWLNAVWDERVAVCVAGASSHVDIDHEDRGDARILFGDLTAGIRLRGGQVALFASPGREAFLDAMDAFEADFGLPRGVRSRRSEWVNEPIFHLSGDFTPARIDEAIGYAKAGDFRLMTFNYSHVFKAAGSWGLCGDYDWRDDLPNREKDVAAMLAKVHAAGLRAGFHSFHPHIGLRSRYVTPVADPRLNKIRRFTLAADLPETTNATEITVWEPTVDTVMHPPCRILQFDGELLSYESYTVEPPYRFLGVRRGALNTKVTAHSRGTVGGILDISEFGTPLSCYVDQNTDLQDEVAAKLARAYNCGFDYVYLDGSEGVNRPFNYHVANAQYRYWRCLSPEPLFGEGAAKTHFGWHMLAGANAFDCFSPRIFKEKLREFPIAQAPITWQDMSRVDFGWWGFWAPGSKDWWGETVGVQLDMWEFGLSSAAAWNCASSILMPLDELKRHPRREDILRVLREWNGLRRRGELKDAWRKRIRETKSDQHLLRLPDGTFDLVATTELSDGFGEFPVRAFAFTREDESCVLFWHTRGRARMRLPLAAGDVKVEDAFGGAALPLVATAEGVEIPADDRRYLRTRVPLADLKSIWAQARLRD